MIATASYTGKCSAAQSPANRRASLLVFADDWGRHPSSCQHLVGQLLGRRRVVWVNTIGTRPPRLDWSTAKRAAGKLREWASCSSESADSRAPGTLSWIARPSVVAPK